MPDLPRLSSNTVNAPYATATLRCVIPPDDSPLWDAVPIGADGVDFYLMEIADDDPIAAMIAPGYAVLDDGEYLDAVPTLANHPDPDSSSHSAVPTARSPAGTCDKEPRMPDYAANRPIIVAAPRASVSDPDAPCHAWAGTQAERTPIRLDEYEALITDQRRIPIRANTHRE